MRSILILFLFIFYLQAPAQQTVQKTAIPPFQLVLTDGSGFSYKNLQKGRPLILVYFAPECDHCRVFMGSLLKSSKKFTHTQIVLVSYFPLPALQQFSHDFKLHQFPNIKLGTEGNSFLIPAYFKIGKFPFTAVFNKAGKLVATFKEAPSAEVLARFVKN